MKKKIVIGMSGGVDSSVAALLLKERGYEVTGVTMLLGPDSGPAQTEAGCGRFTAADDARRVAEMIGIRHCVMDFREVFREKVIDHFVSEYLHARTPNPCLVCNRYVKWEALLWRAGELGADGIATGHYAAVRKLENGRLAVCSSGAGEKDQTYALYLLTQEQLARTVFPLDGYTKPQIRQIAREAGLPVAEKQDSQEICFIPDKNYAGFIEDYTGKTAAPGNFVTEAGEILGQHKGLIRYTIGQRRRLGLPMGRRVFVSELRPETNEVVIAEGDEVFSDTVRADRLNFMGLEDLSPDGERLTGKIRYGHAGAPCTAFRTGEDEITVTFDEPVRAATKGQALVLYQDGCVAAGGTIL